MANRQTLPDTALGSEISNAARCEHHSGEQEKPEVARLREHTQAPRPFRRQAVVQPDVRVMLIHF
ncbi:MULTISPECIES: hypothetical protein [unclassified Streptomyces]|uniref:hypothetical protein n=1 Tax=unclassified Streptomyces TaxID=2593676 RepID=UPI0029BF49C8|nr:MULTISPECIES: hypothetical protein [unclassified Streptomyces]MDX3769676.1 hypothetical protein [Streptomyces sp. AK08-01B]MDX3818931.1 hypothetical protein [Streptomyces sp. AK08-01A]